MAIETNLESIKDNGGEALVKRDQYLIRKELVSTEFEYDDLLEQNGKRKRKKWVLDTHFKFKPVFLVYDFHSNKGTF